MEWHQLKYFQTLANIQHYSIAAEKASISQPALSKAISKLESELDVPLFERKGRNIKLTRYGEIFIKRVENAMREIELGQQEIQDLTDPEYGRIAIAFIHSDFVVNTISMFRDSFPNVKFDLLQTGTKNIIDMLKSGNVDVGFATYVPEQEQGLRMEAIYSEELFIIVSTKSNLSRFDQIELSSIKDEPFITYKLGYGLRTLTDSLCKKAGFSPNIIFEGEENSTILEVVSAGLGVTIVPGSTLLDNSKFKLIRVVNPHCVRTIGMAWREDFYLSPAAKNLINFVLKLHRP